MILTVLFIDVVLGHCVTVSDTVFCNNRTRFE